MLEPAIGNISSIMINSRAFIVAEANNATATSSVEKNEQTIFHHDELYSMQCSNNYIYSEQIAGKYIHIL